MSQPHLSVWAEEGRPLRLVEQPVAKADPDPKALACSGLLVRHADPQPEQLWLRFVAGRPVRGVTTQFLAWCADRLAALGKTALLLVWDNASWHSSRAVRAWVRAHNQQVKRQGVGVRLVVCGLPSKSPWLNPIEPKWVHDKRNVVEADRLLPARELADRVYDYFGCAHEPPLTLNDSPASGPVYLSALIASPGREVTHDGRKQSRPQHFALNPGHPGSKVPCLAAAGRCVLTAPPPPFK